MSVNQLLRSIFSLILVAICAGHDLQNDKNLLPLPVCLDGKMVYINRSGKVVLTTPFDYFKFGKNKFSEGLAGFEENGKYGFIDETGKIVIQPAFDYIGEFSEGIAEVEINRKWGFIDRTGRMLFNLNTIKPRVSGMA